MSLEQEQKPATELSDPNAERTSDTADHVENADGVVSDSVEEKETVHPEPMEESLPVNEDDDSTHEEESQQIESPIQESVESAEEPVEDQDTEEVSQTEEEVKIEESGADTVDTSQPAEEALEEDQTNEQEENEPDPAQYYGKLVAKAEELVQGNDWAFISNELSNINLYIGEGPESDDENVRSLLEKYEALKQDFEERRSAYYEELNARKEVNLAEKKELLKQFAAIVAEEKWTATGEVKQISRKWETIRPIPQSEADSLNERFEKLVEEFESHKVDRLVKKLEKEEENLTLKLLLLDKMDRVNEQGATEEADFEALYTQFKDLLQQWRKVGRVPVEKNEALWDRFNKAQDVFNETRFKFDQEFRKSVERALSKKKKILAEAEALLDEDDLAEASRRVNRLHKAWKKAGNLPQKEENELWDKFKAATDQFNEKKSENIELLHEQEQKNLELKQQLIQKAEQLSDLDDFEAGHKQMQQLMDTWKAIGPVPRKKTSKVWKQFKEAMDAFYEKRREHFKSRRKDQKDNLDVKKGIIEQLVELADHEDPAKAVEEAKQLQQQFKDAGHVPMKFKNKIWKQYREACDVIYENYRSMGSDKGMDRQLAAQGIQKEARKQIIQEQKETDKLRKEITELNASIIQWKEAKTYFKPTKKGNALLDELQQKIDKAEEQVAQKKAELKEHNKSIDILSSSSAEEG